jgi:hypothetical protein
VRDTDGGLSQREERLDITEQVVGLPGRDRV